MNSRLKESVRNALDLVHLELGARLREEKVTALMILLAAGLTLVLSFFIEGRFMSYKEAADVSDALMEMTLSFLALIMFFLVPPLSAEAIAGERRSGSLDMVRVSLITPTGYVVKKTLSILMVCVFLIILCLPAMSVGFFLVGFQGLELWRVPIILLFFAGNFSAIGLGVSSLSKSPVYAIIMSYILILIIWGVTPLLFHLLLIGSGKSDVATFLIESAYFPLKIIFTWPRHYFSDWHLWAAQLAYLSMTSAVFFFIAIMGLRRADRVGHGLVSFCCTTA